MMILGTILLFAVGLVIAALGGYVYHKKQDKELFQHSPLNRISIVGASYLMAFGGILLILAIHLFSQL